MAKWKCDACGDAEKCDASCIVEMWAGEPERCPLTGEECEWHLVKDINMAKNRWWIKVICKIFRHRWIVKNDSLGKQWHCTRCIKSTFLPPYEQKSGDCY